MTLLRIVELIFLYITTGLYVKYVAERYLNWGVELQIAFVTFWPIVVGFCLLTSYLEFWYRLLSGKMNEYDEGVWY